MALLFLGACEGGFVRPTDLGRKVKIEKSYEAREECLERNAATDSAADPATAAQAAAMACKPETDKLIQAVDFDGDARVAASVRQDTQYRATKYVMKARGQALY
ncbi:hypothetical protein [Reyranella sp.]|uniref:hypothetical protein n=1 Tax=Reyranella sp. TaxID=1929291 RepID=UPI003BACABB4